MAYPIELKNQAIFLRKKGFSLKEIAEKLKISKSTASYWLQYIFLNQKAQKRLKKLEILGQYKTGLIKKMRKENLIKEYHLKAYKGISKIPPEQFNKSYLKPNTKIRIRNNYPGCIVVSYYDHSIAKELAALYNSFAKYLGA